MAIGTGSHWKNPLLGSDAAGEGLYEEVPVDVLSRSVRSTWFNDFIFGDDFQSTSWTTTQIAANGTAALDNSGTRSNGFILITSGAVNNDGVGGTRLNIAEWGPSSSASIDGLTKRVISCGARFSVSDYSSSDWIFGLFQPGANSIIDATGAVVTSTDGVGWHHIGEATTQGGQIGPDGNNVRMVSWGTALANYATTYASAGNVAPVALPTDAAIDGTLVDYGFKIIGNQDVEFYRNGRLIHRRRQANVFTSGVQLELYFANVGTGSSIVMAVDYVWVSSSR